MKNIRAIILYGALSATTLLSAADKSLTEQFQQALFEEEANRNLPAAIEGYEAVIKQLDEQRQLAATAVFRMGESYRKLGKTNDAVRAYERILSEFKDQEMLMKLSEQNLSVLRSVRADNAILSIEPTGERQTLRILLQAIKGLPPGSREEMDVIMASQPNPELDRVLRLIDDIRVYLNENENRLGADDPGIKESRTALKSYEDWALQQRDATVAAAEARLAALERLAAAESSLRASGPATRLDPTSRAKQKKLLEQEIALVEEQLKEVRKRVDVGTAPTTEPIGKERELIHLRRQVVALDTTPETILEQRQLIGQEMDLVRQLVDDMKKRMENGKATPTDLIDLERQLLQLMREDLALASKPVSGNATSSAGPAMTAEEAEELRRVQALVANSPDLINIENAQGNPPLHSAISNGYFNVASFLIQNGADLALANRSGLLPIHVALNSDRLEFVKLLLKNGADIDARTTDLNNITPLFDAVLFKSFNVVKFLIENGANPNATLTSSGLTPLHIAAGFDKLDVAKLLIESGADIEAMETGASWKIAFNGTNVVYHGTPLNAAIAKNDTNMVELLLESDANPNPPSPSSPPLLLAVQAGATNLVHRLIESGSHLKNLPLIETATISMPEVIPYLLEHGAKPMPSSPGKPTLPEAPPTSK